MQFIDTFELRDLITIVMSAIALVLSLTSFFFSRVRHDYEDKREIRRQLSEIILKINDTIAETQAIWADLININKPDAQTKLGELNQRNSMLVRQASYLMDDKPELITDVEYLTVATALAGVGDYPKAEEYYLAAIQTAPNAYYRSINLRGYADSLFLSGDDVKGREKYDETLACLPNSGNFNIWHNAQTHQMWGVSESRFGLQVNAKLQFERAKEVFNMIGNQNVKNRGLSTLNQVVDSEFSNLAS